MKSKPKTKRMTFAQFKRRCLHAYAVYLRETKWKDLWIPLCQEGRKAILKGWRLSLLLPAVNASAQLTNVDCCSEVHCNNYGSWYQTLVLPAPRGQLHEFTVLAREHRYHPGLGVMLPHMEPTLHLAFYDTLGQSMDGPATWAQDFSTNNGLICQKLTNWISCPDMATNLWLLKAPLNLNVVSGCFGLWFTSPCKDNWTIPALIPPNGMNPITWQNCLYHIRTNTVHWFKPLYESGGYNSGGYTGYFGIPYAVSGNPLLSITRSASGVTVSWDTNETNLCLISSQGAVLHTNGNVVNLPATNAAELFWLENELPVSKK